ncbi:MAG: hypothetical protein M1827_003867 [Pycnora praestabilis]|nr:MAG: hypothetical protein M1827_003867 [Pycnora praestabilis]
MPPKRPSTGSPALGTSSSNKVPKTENFGPDDFSNSVKKRLQTSTRTGQACDRCKVRKIRCDGLPGGCSPCLQNNSECRTTDRITGRATSRGYVENLEQRARDQDIRIRDLESRLMSLGVEVKPANGYHDPGAAALIDWNTQQANGNPQTWGAGTSVTTAANSNLMNYGSITPSSSTPRPQETNMFRALPVFRTGCNGDNYLGVSSGNSYLSSIRGTALSVLGMEIDLADFTSSDLDEPAPSTYQPDSYNKSYQSFLQSAFNVNPKMDKVELPPRNEGLTYAQWYFRALNPYVPVLHQPTFIALLTRIYDDPEFRPSAAETVMVHMIFAIMFFQYAARNWENATQQSDLNTRSNIHYHYSLGFFYHLIASHTLQDVQALTLICSHLRNFPKPGAAWMTTSITFTLAIELGLHRSAKRWVQNTPQKNALEIEMRKRVFWGILAIHIAVGGKLGRPMPIRIEDIDVEVPEPIDDELLSEQGVDSSRPGKCTFRIAIEAFKGLPLFMEVFGNVYAVKRSPQTYIETIRRLEVKLEQWREQWSADLIQESASNEQEGRIQGLYAHMWYLEFRLLLRHPSLSLTSSSEINNENLDICLESARSMLHTVRQLQKYKSLDTTWYNGAVYLMAITTTLFAQWERRDQTTTASLAQLREEMDMWLDIMGDVGGLLGSGKRLREAVQVVTDGTIGMLSRNLASNTASAAVASSNLDRSRSRSPGEGPPPGPDSNYSSTTYPNAYQDPNNGSNSSMNGGVRGNNYISPDDPSMNGHTPTPYPAVTQYAYPEPSTSSYPAPPHPFEAASSYPDPANALSSTSNAHQTPASTGAFMFSNNPATYPQNQVIAGSQSWRQWTGTMAGNLEPQDCYSASALMQLGGRDLGNQDVGSGGAPVADMTGGIPGSGASADGGMSGGAGQPWPLMIFDIGQGGT